MAPAPTRTHFGKLGRRSAASPQAVSGQLLNQRRERVFNFCGFVGGVVAGGSEKNCRGSQRLSCLVMQERCRIVKSVLVSRNRQCRGQERRGQPGGQLNSRDRLSPLIQDFQIGVVDKQAAALPAGNLTQYAGVPQMVDGRRHRRKGNANLPRRRRNREDRVGL